MGQGLSRSTACLSDRMSRSEGPFLVALHLTASQVMMKNSEGVLNAANILNVLGVTHCRARCAVRWQRCCSLGHLEVQGRWVDSFFNGARGGNPPPRRKSTATHWFHISHGLHMVWIEACWQPCQRGMVIHMVYGRPLRSATGKTTRRRSERTCHLKRYYRTAG